MRITGTLTAKNDATVLAAMRAGDERARQKLITGYLWLVPAILDKGQSGRALFSPENPAYLDAIQEGNLALVEAASTLPPGIPFAEHAAACIVQAIKKARPKFLKESGFSDRVKILLGIVVTEA